MDENTPRHDLIPILKDWKAKSEKNRVPYHFVKNLKSYIVQEIIEWLNQVLYNNVL